MLGLSSDTNVEANGIVEPGVTSPELTSLDAVPPKLGEKLPDRPGVA